MDAMPDALRRKVARKLLPFLMLCYFAAFLDRVNVGFAALTMNRDLGLSDEAYGLGAGLFFLGYFLFEVPSNLILERVGARVWIARIMVTWALVSGATAFATGPYTFYLARFLLGLAEAGFFPGIILYLTYWFPARHRAGIVGAFMMAVPLSAAIGAPLSGLILSMSDGSLGLAGWQWLFLVEAAPSLVLGLLALVLLADRPEAAAWLAPDERAQLARTMARDRRENAQEPATGLSRALLRPQVMGLGLVYMGISAGLYGIGLWLPQVVAGFGFQPLATGFVSGLPYLVAALGMVAWSRRSDRTGERGGHVAVAAIGGGLALALAGYAGSPVLAVLALSLACLGVFAALPVFWSLPTALLSGSAAAGGIALVNAVGGLGGFLGPYLVGSIRGATGAFGPAFLAIAVCMVGAGLLALRLGRAAAASGAAGLYNAGGPDR